VPELPSEPETVPDSKTEPATIRVVFAQSDVPEPSGRTQGVLLNEAQAALRDKLFGEVFAFMWNNQLGQVGCYYCTTDKDGCALRLRIRFVMEEVIEGQESV